MATHRQISRSYRAEMLWLAGLTLAATAAAAVLTLHGNSAFARYFGPVPPRAVTLGAGVIAAGVWRLARVSGRRPATVQDAGLIALAATGFAALTIASDIAAPYPAGINVALPAALLFYPAIGFVVDVLFHLLPFALALGLLRAAGMPPRAALVCAVSLAALTEPAFQVAAGFGAGPPWREIYLSLHLFAFGAVQLFLLIRHGFVEMLGFRLVYYLHWHILWGTARLEWLF